MPELKYVRRSTGLLVPKRKLYVVTNSNLSQTGKLPVPTIEMVNRIRPKPVVVTAEIKPPMGERKNG